MRVTIHDLSTDPVTTYTVDSPEQCRHATDRSAAQSAFETGLTVTMGCVIAQPRSDRTVAQVNADNAVEDARRWWADQDRARPVQCLDRPADYPWFGLKTDREVADALLANASFSDWLYATKEDLHRAMSVMYYG